MTSPRKLAQQLGQVTYETGLPCKNGHIAPRNTGNGNCSECARIRRAEAYHENPEHEIALVRAYQKRNAEKVKETKRRVYEANREHYLRKASEWRAANRPLHHAYLKAWFARNVDRNRFYCAKRHASKLQRTPAWAEIRLMDDFYRKCPEGHHVDHIIPLRGRLVSGLHVLGNLQYLPATENLRKKNKFDPWTFEA